jgi:hypothetical protein
MGWNDQPPGCKTHLIPIVNGDNPANLFLFLDLSHNFKTDSPIPENDYTFSTIIKIIAWGKFGLATSELFFSQDSTDPSPNLSPNHLAPPKDLLFYIIKNLKKSRILANKWQYLTLLITS